MDGEGRIEHHGYQVVPAALRNAQRTYDAVADAWEGLHQAMQGWKLGDDDLGLLGRRAGVVGDYNGAVDTILDKLQTGMDQLRAASDALNQVATAYEAQDAEYYAKFGWTAAQMDSVAPAPG